MLTYFCLIVSLTQALASSPFWPQPHSFSTGADTLFVSATFSFSLQQQSDVLSRASERYIALIDATDSPQDGKLISTCVVEVAEIAEDEYATLQLGIDESYTLILDSSGSCSISSQTIWGALHAFETFTQLLTRDGGYVFTDHAPVQVTDFSRFTHRGMLIDTSRHYLPVSFLQQVIDSLPMSKFNVLHWHMVDAQSFPVDTPSAPRMVHGAYNPSMTYSMDDITMLTSYAADRGVRLLLEVDVPGHAAAWTKGYPHIMAKCFMKYSYNINDFALDPTEDETYSVLANVLGDIVKASGTKNLHLGGDEVVYGCWANDTSIISFMADNNIPSYDALLEYFVLKADDITRSLGATPVHWEEVFKAGAKVGMDVIFEVWTSQSVIASVVEANYSVIAAPSDVWYLDHADNTWQVMYGYDPSNGLTSTQATKIVGGEVAMWGEHVDENNLMGIVYPRACAVGERLWSDASVVDTDDALERLLLHRCRLVARGVKSGAVQPGFCAATYVGSYSKVKLNHVLTILKATPQKGDLKEKPNIYHDPGSRRVYPDGFLRYQAWNLERKLDGAGGIPTQVT